jgi:sec-independent protein translocase protein TatB
MFDIGWSEILVIAVVAIVVVGPKELPRMLRTFGKTMGQVRRMSNDFKRQFDEALREAEREAGLEDTKKQLQSAMKPLSDVRKDLDETVRTSAGPVTPSPAVPKPTPPPAPPDARPHEAEPAKVGAAPPAHESDAA